jgi:hypothetical protein
MVRKNSYNTSTATKSAGGKGVADISLSEVAVVLAKVKQLLDEQCPEKAMDVITRNRFPSPWISNATGVCAMRLGNVKEAARVFQSLVGHLGTLLKPEAPLVFKTNFATALLASNNMAGCLSVLHEIQQEDNLTVKRLREAIEQWKRSLTLWQKFKWYTGDIPTKPIALDFPLGELE